MPVLSLQLQESVLSPRKIILRYFKVLIFGPTSSPYEGMAGPRFHLLSWLAMACQSSPDSHVRYLAGGIFKLELFLPEDYPMAAPKVWLHTCMLLLLRHHQLLNSTMGCAVQAEVAGIT